MCLSQVVGGGVARSPMSPHIVPGTIHGAEVPLCSTVKGKQVMIRTDNKTAEAIINGVLAVRILELAGSLSLWSLMSLCSIRAIYILGKHNWTEGPMSCGGPSHSKWKLNLSHMQAIWDRFGKAEVDLFASQQNAQCAVWSVVPTGLSFIGRGYLLPLTMVQSPSVPLVPRFLAYKHTFRRRR